VGGRAGEQLPNTPKWSGTLGFRYGFDVGSLPAYVSGSYRYNGEFPVGFGGVTIDGQAFPSASPRLINDAYDIVNLQLGVSTEHFDVSAYVTNLFDEYGYSNITTSTTAPATAIPLRPRTVGMMLKTKF
jgi:outer membrane receptor protein involved in Fe transport